MIVVGRRLFKSQMPIEEAKGEKASGQNRKVRLKRRAD